MAKIKVVTGDTGVTPYGGGTWASRGAGIGGEAVLQAGRALRSNMLDVAAHILKADKAELDISQNQVVSLLTQEPKMPLAELGRVAYFRPDTLPPRFMVSAMSPDGIIEAMEATDGRKLWAVQFHPERLFHGDEKMLGIFRLLTDNG